MLFSKACDITGIVAIACARHGCFAPNSIVDLTRGEQQKNVDWAMLEAIRSTGIHSDQGILFIYDLVCQYFIHLEERIGHLLPAGLDIDRAIGLFHVHDHKDECFYRFASSFISGASIVAGEILESLWSVLNTITPSTRTATLAHRAEIIDDHASDSNHKKALGMGKMLHFTDTLTMTILTATVLSDRFAMAREMVRESTAYFDQLSSPIHKSIKEEWEREIESAERHRFKDPSVMDVLGARDTESTGIDRAPNQTLMQSSKHKWLHLALSIEEQQYVIP